MKLATLTTGLMLAASAVARSVLYVDEWHLTDMPSRDLTAGVTHAIMAFANPANFTQDPPQGDPPFESVETFRARFDSGTKVMIAVGGWGYCPGFRTAAATNASRALFAKNLAAMIDNYGFDGIDIDWEYPGGNCADYKTLEDYDSSSEIETFPLLLKAIRQAINPKKVLSIAVPGLKRDMIAFTQETGPKIWKSLDFVNIMSYDLMNRRDHATRHHTSVLGSLHSVDNYLSIGLPPVKANLGLAFYAKWFKTAEDCTSHPIGCPTVALENADGLDTGESGALTFEKSNMAPVPKNLTQSSDGSCGYSAQKICPAGYCCSQYGYCGNSSDFCSPSSCQSGYGICDGPTVQDSWRKVANQSLTDNFHGAEYAYDSEQQIFWSWDTAPLIARKFEQIIKARQLGGIMAWSAGEDGYDWSHLKAMQAGARTMAPLWKAWGVDASHYGRHSRPKHHRGISLK